MNNSTTTTTNNGGEPDPALCDVVSVIPASLHLDEPEHTLQIEFACDGDFPAERLGESITFRGTRSREGNAALAVTSHECEPGQGELTCVAVFEGLQTPGGSPDDNLGHEMLTFEDQLGFEFEVPIRWGLSPEQVAGRMMGRDVVPMPPEVSERALDIRVKETVGGRIVAGVLRAVDNSGVELFSVSGGNLTIHETFAVDPDDTENWGFSFALVEGKGELDWWGFDPTAGTLQGHSVVIDADGNVDTNVALDTSDYQGPDITEVLGVAYQVGAAPGGVRATGRALVKTTIGSIAVLALGSEFQPDSLLLVNQFDALGRTPATQLEKGQVGLTMSNSPDTTTEPYIWRVNEDRQFALYSLAGGELGAFVLQLTEVQWPFRLEPIGLTERHFVFGLTADGATRASHMLAVWTQDGEPLLGRAEQLTLPSKCRPGGRISFRSAAPTQFGQVCNEQTTGVPMMVDWDLTERVAGAREAVRVTPLVRQTYAAPSEGDEVLVSVLEDGTLAVDRVADLSATCENLEDCAQPITGFTTNGWRLNLVPGVTGPAWAVDKYGDILIDGVPLVFDLTQPPIIVDAPGAAGQDSGAFIVAGIESDDGTHAVWRVGADGTFSSPGLLQLDTGDPNTDVVLTDAVSGSDGATVVFTLEVVNSRLGEEPGSSVGGTLEVGASSLDEAVASDAAVPFSTEGPEFSLASAGAKTYPLAPVASAPYSFSDSSDVVLMQQLSAAQADRPLVVTHDEGGMALRSAGDDGDDPLDTLLDDEPVANENPIFIDMGSGGNILRGAQKKKVKRDVTKVRRRNEASAKRVRRVRLQSYNLEAGPAEPSACVTVSVSQLPASVEGDEFLVLGTSDYNGDGIGDLMLRAEGESGAILVFSDGRGGFAEGSIKVPGGPDEEFVQRVDANGKGTRKAASALLQNSALELL
jgi:hypothetical protein